MDPLNPLPAIAALFAAIATAFFIARFFGAPPSQGRFASIDGLRGYLAFFVFLHHAGIWYFYLRTDQWVRLPSHLFTHFGYSSVAMFFMITGFLFFSKIIDGRTARIDWTRLFVSRFMRLTPLYLFAMGLLFSVVAWLSDGILNESFPQLMKGVTRWLSFTIFDEPDLNQIRHTSLIVAGVTWSLPYEWFFYFSLPILALMVRVVAPLPYILLGAAAITGFAIWQPEVRYLFAFLGGIAASFLVRVEAFRKFSQGNLASFAVLGLVAVTVAVFPSTLGIWPILLLSLAFSLIAGGNSLFKLLTSAFSRTLGEMAYSIYLLHGITLFVLFTFVIGVDNARQFSALSHWMIIIGVCPVLVLFCYGTFRFIERPGMQNASAVTAWLRSHLNWLSRERQASGETRY